MRPSLVFALILSFGHTPVAMAGETLLQSSTRITREAAKSRPAPAAPPALPAQPTTLAQSGMRKRTKFLIAMGIAGAFAGVAVAVDRGVEDSTPSSLGQR